MISAKKSSSNGAVPSTWVQLLASLAFVGIERGLFSEARSLLSTLVALCPNNTSAKVAKGIGEVLMNRRNEGLKLLYECLKADPDNEAIKVWIVFGLKYHQLHSEASEVAHLLLKDCQDPDCQVLVRWIDETSYASPTSLLTQQAKTL